MATGGARSAKKRRWECPEADDEEERARLRPRLRPRRLRAASRMSVDCSTPSAASFATALSSMSIDEASENGSTVRSFINLQAEAVQDDPFGPRPPERRQRRRPTSPSSAPPPGAGVGQRGRRRGRKRSASAGGGARAAGGPGGKRARLERCGRTPLHLAVELGFQDMVEILVEAGADVNALDEYGRTPLQIARECGYSDIDIYLHSAGSVSVADAP